MPTYARADLAFERGEGAYLYTDDGRRFLDFAAGIAVNALGHAHPRLVEALTGQGAKLWHTANLYRIPGQERLAERLVAATFADSVFFNNTGAEAVECSLKLARKFQHEQGHAERYRFITCEGAFHGRTLATIAAGGQEKHLAGFEPVVDGFDQVPWGNLNELRAAITPRTAGILVEPVQGEGGIRAADPEFLRGLRATADEFGLVLVFDEVQTGMGRTGKLFAHEWAGMAPDVMAIAKALGGGFPIGACLATERFASALTAGSHGSTFGGNPLAMAVANAVLDVMLGDGFLAHVREMGELLRGRLEDIAGRYGAIVEEVRGLGLMIGIRLKVDNVAMVGRFTEGGLLSVGAGENVVRLLPPLIIEKSHVEEAAAIIERAFAETPT